MRPHYDGSKEYFLEACMFTQHTDKEHIEIVSKWQTGKNYFLSSWYVTLIWYALEGLVLSWRDLYWVGGTCIELEGLVLSWSTLYWVGVTCIEFEGLVLSLRDSCWVWGTRIEFEGPVLSWRDSYWVGGSLSTFVCHCCWWYNDMD